MGGAKVERRRRSGNHRPKANWAGVYRQSLVAVVPAVPSLAGAAVRCRRCLRSWASSFAGELSAYVQYFGRRNSTELIDTQDRFLDQIIRAGRSCRDADH
jgi:hypothetical protein